MAEQQQQQMMAGIAQVFSTKYKHHKTVMVVGGITIALVAFTLGGLTTYAVMEHNKQEARRKAALSAAAATAYRRQKQNENNNPNPDTL